MEEFHQEGSIFDPFFQEMFLVKIFSKKNTTQKLKLIRIFFFKFIIKDLKLNRSSKIAINITSSSFFLYTLGQAQIF